MGAISDTLVDSIVYWAPGQLESSGATVYAEGDIVNRVRVDASVDKVVRDLLVDKKPKMTVWSLRPFEVGGWLCSASAYNDVSAEYLACPQLIEGARQILHVDNVASYDRSEVFWRAVV